MYHISDDIAELRYNCNIERKLKEKYKDALELIADPTIVDVEKIKEITKNALK